MENEIYVVEVCLAPGYWELATDTYFTGMESAEAAKMDIMSIMKKIQEGRTGIQNKTTYK